MRRFDWLLIGWWTVGLACWALAVGELAHLLGCWSP